jgi:alpha/beta superfamily hydrolase
MRKLFLLIFIALIFLPARAKALKVPYDGNGNYFLLLSPRRPVHKIAVLVHGGGFYSGGPAGPSMRVLMDYFLQRGYYVASLSYRLCGSNGVRWPVPVEDIKAGIEESVSYIRGMDPQVTDVVITGYSAGAVAASLILYAQEYPKLGIGLPLKFLGLSGVYNSLALTPASDRTIFSCDIDIKTALDFYPIYMSHVSSLLIEGETDVFDAFHLDPESHNEFLSALLNEKGTWSLPLWCMDGGHTCPVERIYSGDPAIVGVIDDFLEIPLSVLLLLGEM